MGPRRCLACAPYLHAREAQIITILGNPTSTLGRNSLGLDAYPRSRRARSISPLRRPPRSLSRSGTHWRVSLDDPRGHHRPKGSHATTRLGGSDGGSRCRWRISCSRSRSWAASHQAARCWSVLAGRQRPRGVGAALVVEDDRLVVSVTDGDVRRGLANLGSRPLHSEVAASELMTAEPEVVGDEPAYSALVHGGTASVPDLGAARRGLQATCSLPGAPARPRAEAVSRWSMCVPWPRVPARMASSRLPGKPLLRLQGRTIVQWVCDATIRESGVFDRVLGVKRRADPSRGGLLRR